MSRVLAVPNWSIYRTDFESIIQEEIHSLGLDLHYAKSDIDHRRAVTGFSGSSEQVFLGMNRLCEKLLPMIDLSDGKGVHPRSGALDVAPFVSLGIPIDELVALTRSWAQALNSTYSIPSYLYEKAAFDGRETRLPVLRGQIGQRPMSFDFGNLEHPRWGYSVVGVRSFLLAVNLNFSRVSLKDIQSMAKCIRQLREEGDATFQGVRALGFELKSRNLVQLSMNFTNPDATSFDEIYRRISERWFAPCESELIGVIRSSDALKASTLSFDHSQIVD